MHLLSRYVIRPSAFDRDPYSLPKTASINKYQHPYAKNAAHVKGAAQPEAVVDDFETVEAPKKKEKKIKPVAEAEQHEEIKEPEIKVVTPVVEAPKPIEQPKIVPKIVEAPKNVAAKVVEEPKTAVVEVQEVKAAETKKKPKKQPVEPVKPAPVAVAVVVTPVVVVPVEVPKVEEEVK